MKKILLRNNQFITSENGKHDPANNTDVHRWLIVGVSDTMHRAWFREKMDYADSPDCWSSDGVKPDAEVDVAPSDSCSKCRYDIKGSGDHNSKACKYSIRLAVMLEGDEDHNLYQVILSSASIFGEGSIGKHPYQAYVKHLKKYKLGVTHVVTEVKFDTEHFTPRVLFRPLRAVTEEEYNVLSIARGCSKVKELTKLVVVKNTDLRFSEIVDHV
jgi:hypothetical protein